MSSPISMMFFLVLLIIALPYDIVGQLAKPGCSDTCGNVRISYPFGIGPGCAINQSYTIVCTSSKPYLSELNLEVLNVSVDNRTITVNTPINYSCSSQSQTGAVTSWNSSNLAGTPFFFSKVYNKMMLFGCGNVVLRQNNNILTGCTSTCEFNSSQVTPSCNGVNCCETINIPFYLTKYHLNFTVSRFNTRNCSAAFFADRNWSAENFSELSLQNVPVVLTWILQRINDSTVFPCSYSIDYLELESEQKVESIMCSKCGFRQITAAEDEMLNPYLQGECNPSFIREPVNNVRAAIVGVGTSIGFLLQIATIFAIYKLVKRKRERKMKDKCFKRNGGLLLQQQLSADEGVVEKTRIFTADELEKASDGFNASLILGQGGQGTVYKGMLTDGKLVAIKKSRKINESQLEQFINELVILSQVNHRNVLKLLGCCLETEVPVLVYEFIPNGTLFSLIHNQSDDDFPFTWNLRLRIATEVAGALAYLHSAISIPIYHRDIKSSNILLDEKFIAKVADFGISRSVAVDKTHLTTQVKGTFGYLDPEYFQSSQFTEKSDVYSFGVVLVELLTRRKPISSADQTEEESHLSLATRFLMCMDENCLNNILDPLVLDQSNEEDIIVVAKLAQRCLDLNGKKRPTTKEVALELESIKSSSTRSTIVEENFHRQRQGFSIDGESKSVVFSNTNPSWTTETGGISLASDADPLIDTG